MVNEQSLSSPARPGQTLGGQDELSRLKLQFLASLNHEIRTPLTGILGMTDLLLETALNEEQREYTTAARMCAESLLEILSATLEYTALSAGNVMLEQAEFHLAETLRSAVDGYREQAAQKDLTLRLVLDASVPELAVGDARRVRQLVSYLVSNAVKFTHLGSITVDAFAEPDGADRATLTVSVLDTGIGIAPDALRTIFESFRQLESGLSRSYNGLGLGLALAQKLVGIMGGRIEVESAPSQGSRFWFSIPLQPAEPQARTEAMQPRQDYHLLVVEDNAVAQDVVRHVLKRRPYSVDFVATGEDAVDAAGTTRYDLILMDLQMPGMDGLQASSKIRGIEAYWEVPILAFTANASDEYRSLCRQHGLEGFVSKPIQADEMLRTLDRYLP